MQKQTSFINDEKPYKIGDLVIIGNRQYKILRFHPTSPKVHLEFITSDNEKVQEWKLIAELPPYPTGQESKSPATTPGQVPTFEVGHKRKSYGGVGPSLEVVAVLPHNKYKCKITLTGDSGEKLVTKTAKEVATFGNAVVPPKAPSTGGGPDSLRLGHVYPSADKETVKEISKPITPEPAEKPSEKPAEPPPPPIEEPADKEKTQEVEVVHAIGGPKKPIQTIYRREMKFMPFIIHDEEGFHHEEAAEETNALLKDGWRESNIEYKTIVQNRDDASKDQLVLLITFTRQIKVTS